ncbi:MAG: hypothetical protein ACRCTY_01505 [Candidatus Adiutrix sp.]
MPIYEIDLTQELLSTLELALRITGDDKNEVFKRLINQYASDVLRQMKSQAMLESGQAISSVIEPPRFHSKAYKRFPKWANKPYQTNHQIVKAFFACESNGVASRGEMCNVFMKNNPERASYFFENNLNSMATDTGNSHGKCFDIIGDAVRFTAEIYPLAQQYKYLFQRG